MTIFAIEMKNEFQYVQCIPLTNFYQVRRKIQQALRLSRCFILLDLEDGIFNPDSRNESENLKRNALAVLNEIIKKFSREIILSRFYLRVNQHDSDLFFREVNFLSKANLKFKGIFLPKVESPAHLETYSQVLTDKHATSLCPIFESAAALKNLDDILKYCAGKKISIFSFGNYDYNLSLNQNPIVEQDEKKYWEIIFPLIEKVELYGFSFGNSPYGKLGKEKTFLNILEQLHVVCKRNFFQVTLNHRQSEICEQYPNLKDFLEDNKEVHFHSREEIRQTYLRFKNPTVSTAFLPKNKQIITPQEYLIAKNK